MRLSSIINFLCIIRFGFFDHRDQIIHSGIGITAIVLQQSLIVFVVVRFFVDFPQQLFELGKIIFRDFQVQQRINKFMLNGPGNCLFRFTALVKRPQHRIVERSFIFVFLHCFCSSIQFLDGAVVVLVANQQLSQCPVCGL